MRVFIQHIETLVPPHEYEQEFIREQVQQWLGDPYWARVAGHVFRKSGIERRFSVLADLEPGVAAELYRRNAAGQIVEPTTCVRNRCFMKWADRLGVGLAQRILENVGSFHASDITHLITVSCTGFSNPGFDYRIVTELGLPQRTQRYHLGFMGCYAAFPALRMARQFCEANPQAVVLVVCLELCTLHLQVRPNADSIMGNALFGDGAAAAIVSARQPAGERPVLELLQFESALVPEGRGDMAWEIGDSGFNLVLSSYVPNIIGANVAGIVDHLLAQSGRRREEVELWAIHPGGRAILDKIQSALELSSEQLYASRDVLRRFGNLSSATVLFVLRELLAKMPEGRGQVCAMAFGPGLAIETALMQWVPAQISCTTRPQAAVPLEIA